MSANTSFTGQRDQIAVDIIQEEEPLQLGPGSPRRRYCARPCLCRDRAYRDRRPAKAAMPERLALARAGQRLDQAVLPAGSAEG
ncbi:hypothetical protein AF335_21200 [Streptomyces eurocidicus]|uniref:Uncharacterized protein n=1 Tax=Streptomyces eurocidicus TaxID=66423 RepID=A0A2N8NTZ9_STREU|nr:hypothetical protein [Streptomyces eurocidicus]MBF6053119.1 hypothetical protein [Streptomyces eurocidicus]PNE32224.1 hypothetical protein AF335_21200 [Streptomyces eurocidicus]